MSAQPPPRVTEDTLVVKRREMSDETYEIVKNIVLEAFRVHDHELQCARQIKLELDSKLGPKWQCVVGRHFATHVSYESNTYLYVKIGKEVCLIFKSGSTVNPGELKI